MSDEKKSGESESGWDEQNTKKARRKMCAVVVKKRRNVNLNHPPQFMWVGYSVNSANKPYHMNIGLFLGDTLSCEVNFFNSSTTRLSPAGGASLLSSLCCVCVLLPPHSHTHHTPSSSSTILILPCLSLLLCWVDECEWFPTTLHWLLRHSLCWKAIL